LEKPLQVISLPCLREYLGEQFGKFATMLPFTYDIERIIDDFVFICFFVGNDFLPHLPSLSIREGSIDQMVCLYSEILPTLGDYLTDSGTVNLVQTEVFLDYLGRVEDQVFKARLSRDDRLRQQRAQSRTLPGAAGSSASVGMLGRKRLAEDANLTQARRLLTSLAQIKQQMPEQKKPRLVENLKADQGQDEEGGGEMMETLAHGESGEFYSEVRNKLMQRQDLGDRFPDTIRLGADNAWKQRYYFEKFSIKQEDLLDFVARIRQAYIEGVQWVLLYYYQGCASWTWYYPYHYAPFASDLVGCSTLRCADAGYFECGKPFEPFMQLMAVLPPRSAKTAGLPTELQRLFSTTDSPLIDFYPEDFALDLNGKKFLWQAVVLLPFIKEERLVSVLEPILGEMKEEELRKRNSLGTHVLYVPAADNLARQMEDISGKVVLKDLPYTDPRSQGNTLFGMAEKFPEKNVPEEVSCPISNRGSVKNPRIVRALFDDAKPPASAPLHSTHLLPGAVPPAAILDVVDFAETSRWRGFGGEPAKRMILQVLQELGFHTAQHIAKPVGPSELSGPPAAFPGAARSGGFAAPMRRY
jgi:5'-3' exoribonuclease 2